MPSPSPPYVNGYWETGFLLDMGSQKERKRNVRLPIKICSARVRKMMRCDLNRWFFSLPIRRVLPGLGSPARVFSSISSKSLAGGKDLGKEISDFLLVRLKRGSWLS